MKRGLRPSPRVPRTLRTLLFAAAVATCHSDGGGGGGVFLVIFETEPNGTTATANAFFLNRAGVGDVGTAGDVDYWRISLSGGRLIQIELFATRLDQGGWDATGNVPRLTLLGTDGVTKLLEHDYNGTFSGGWGWGAHDLDFPAFRIPATGTYFVCVTQDDPTLAGGGYAVRVSLVDLGSLQVEVEPEGTTGFNDTAGTAQRIIPGTVRGFHVDDEVDWYSFAIAGPSLVTFELKSYRNGVFGGDDDYFDTDLDLIDTDGTTVLANNDDVFFSDSAVHFSLNVPGTYYIVVGECCGAGDARYFLAFTLEDTSGGIAESEPNDTSGTANAIAYGSFVSGSMDVGDADYFAFAGDAGDMVRLEWGDLFGLQGGADAVTVDLLDTDGATPLSFDAGIDVQVLTTILQSTGTFFVRVTPDATPVATGYVLRLARFKSAAYETEPNDTLPNADTLDGNARAAGAIAAAADVDVFKFIATKNVLVTIAIFADDAPTGSNGFDSFSGHGSDLDPHLTIKNTVGAVIASSTSAPPNLVYTEGVVDGLPTAAVSFVPAGSGTHYVEVTDAAGGGSAAHFYVVEKR